MKSLTNNRFRCLRCGLTVTGVIAAMAHVSLERRGGLAPTGEPVTLRPESATDRESPTTPDRD